MAEDEGGESACFAHELRQLDDGAFVAHDPEQHRDVMRWRKSERERLIALRLAAGQAERAAWSSAIADTIAAAHDFEGRTISFYWPFRGEPDLRPLMETVRDRGGTCALPVVIEKAKPLEFRVYAPGDRLERGVWNIPVPADGRTVNPDIVIAPVVGFDGQRYRLGYGGGFFDRTLAALPARPRVIGVGYDCARIATIFPQPHDIAMDVIVTQSGPVLMA